MWTKEWWGRLSTNGEVFDWLNGMFGLLWVFQWKGVGEKGGQGGIGQEVGRTTSQNLKMAKTVPLPDDNTMEANLIRMRNVDN